MTEKKDAANGSRRDFLIAGAAAAVAANLEIARSAHASGTGAVKVGLIGCGGRGTGAATDIMQADKRAQIVALADVFSDRLEGSRALLKEKGKEQFAVKDDHCFVGFDAFKKMVQSDVDVVILATPPHFRHEHLAAAVEAGKNVFMEKPVAVDPPGCRSVIASGELAKKKNLTVVAGTQRRHEAPYLEAVKRIRDGQIGKIVAARCYWNQSQLWYKPRQSGWSDMEWMIRDWVNWTWLSGDHICEQHVHNLDVVNWFTDSHPVKAVGMGQARRVTGDQFDFFAVDYEFGDGMHSASYCRQINDCATDISETVIGEKGLCYSHSGHAELRGEKPWRYQLEKGKKFISPYVQEHVDLIDSIVNGKGLNEATNVATSTLTAIMGRIAAYTGTTVTWDDVMKSDLRLGPAQYTLEAKFPEVQVPVPGRA